MQKKVSLILFITLGWGLNILKAQNRVLDSLNALFLMSNDTNKVLVLSKIATKVSVNNPQQGEVLADSAVKFAKRINYKYGMAQAYQAIAHAQNTIGKYDLAITNLLKAVDIYAGLKNRKGLIYTYNTLANAYLGLKSNDKAFANYNNANLLAKQEPIDKHMVAVTSIGLANVLLEKKEYQKGISYFLEAEKQFLNDNKELMAAYARGMIGEAYLRMSNLPEAEKNVLKAIPIFEKNNDEYALGLNYYNLGHIYYKKNQLDKAINYFNTSLKLSINRKAWDNIQENALKLSEVYEKNKNLAEALTTYKLFSQYKDSVINKDRNKAIAEAESKFESEKKEQQLKLKNAELQTSELKVNQRNNLIYVFVSVIALFIILLFLVYKQYSQKKKANFLLTHKNEQIQKQKAVIEEKNKDITDSINYAKHIQQAIIPSQKKVKQHLPNSFVVFKPKDVVSGDFYLIDELDSVIYIAVVDCTGHGVPGAMLSVFANASIKNIIGSNNFKTNPAGILTELCLHFKNNLKSHSTNFSINDGVDISICCINRQQNKLYYAGAKNNLLQITSNNEIVEHAANRFGISGSNSEEQLQYTNHVIDLNKGSKFYLSTDGFADQFGGPKGKKFKYKQLINALKAYNKLNFYEQADNLINDFYLWKGNLEQIDDVTLIGFEV
ncbi:MAG: tetratricopeptide repeat protein [Bacteroidota bacterium]|nr:tetratricopeptide repeat protein [Bacteroidota bacterium]